VKEKKLPLRRFSFGGHELRLLTKEKLQNEYSGKFEVHERP
jgi:hypothetical protein